jgi:hypothetical protein
MMVEKFILIEKPSVNCQMVKLKCEMKMMEWLGCGWLPFIWTKNDSNQPPKAAAVWANSSPTADFNCEINKMMAIGGRGGEEVKFIINGHFQFFFCLSRVFLTANI